MISSGNDYASALFMLASENDKLKEFSDDLDVVRKVFRENPDYALLITSPNIPKNERLSAIDSAFGNSISEYIVNFIKVLCEHNKILSLEDCIKDFKALKKQAENCVTAHVYTAVPIDKQEEEKIKSALERKLSRSVIIKTFVDESMLGGVKIEFDGKVIDGSVKRQLHDIKEVISK